jgi:hypothetical protein
MRKLSNVPYSLIHQKIHRSIIKTPHLFFFSFSLFLAAVCCRRLLLLLLLLLLV